MPDLWRCSTGEGVIPLDDSLGAVWFARRISAADIRDLPGMHDPLSDEEQE